MIIAIMLGNEAWQLRGARIVVQDNGQLVDYPGPSGALGFVLGGVRVQNPQATAMYDGYLPAITVQSPAIGDQVSSPVIVSVDVVRRD
jgi:hypothetical protein